MLPTKKLRIKFLYLRFIIFIYHWQFLEFEIIWTIYFMLKWTININTSKIIIFKEIHKNF